MCGGQFCSAFEFFLASCIPDGCWCAYPVWILLEACFLSVIQGGFPVQIQMHSLGLWAPWSLMGFGIMTRATRFLDQGPKTPCSLPSPVPELDEA